MGLPFSAGAVHWYVTDEVVGVPHESAAGMPGAWLGVWHMVVGAQTLLPLTVTARTSTDLDTPGPRDVNVWESVEAETRPDTSPPRSNLVTGSPPSDAGAAQLNVMEFAVVEHGPIVGGSGIESVVHIVAGPQAPVPYGDSTWTLTVY